MGFEILSGLFFLWTTLYVVSDRLKAEEEEKRLIAGKVRHYLVNFTT